MLTIEPIEYATKAGPQTMKQTKMPSVTTTQQQEIFDKAKLANTNCCMEKNIKNPAEIEAVFHR